MLKIDHEIRDDMLLLSPEGRIDSHTADEFGDAIAELSTPRTKGVVIDLAKTEYVSSAGLRVILIAAKAAETAGGRLTLCGPTGVVKEVISVTGFDDMLGVHGSIEAAIAALAG